MQKKSISINNYNDLISACSHSNWYITAKTLLWMYSVQCTVYSMHINNRTATESNENLNRPIHTAHCTLHTNEEDWRECWRKFRSYNPKRISMSHLAFSFYFWLFFFFAIFSFGSLFNSPYIGPFWFLYSALSLYNIYGCLLYALLNHTHVPFDQTPHWHNDLYSYVPFVILKLLLRISMISRIYI